MFEIKDKVKVIANMSNSISQDAHNLNAALIKKYQNHSSEPNTHPINLSIQSKLFPHSWKIALVTPIHKSGDKDMASNCRPIAILQVVSKVLETIVAELNQLLHHHWTKAHRAALDKGHAVEAVFLDLKKPPTQCTTIY